MLFITSLLTIHFFPWTPMAPEPWPGDLGIIHHTPYSYKVCRTFHRELRFPAPMQSVVPPHGGAIVLLGKKRKTWKLTALLSWKMAWLDLPWSTHLRACCNSKMCARAGHSQPASPPTLMSQPWTSHSLRLCDNSAPFLYGLPSPGAHVERVRENWSYSSLRGRDQRQKHAQCWAHRPCLENSCRWGNWVLL